MHTLTGTAASPLRNTGMQNTSGVFLDWLACTFLERFDIHVLARELGASLTGDAKWTKGAMGYTDVWSVFGGWIGINPQRPDMGIHFNLSAKALDQFRLATHKTDASIVNWLCALGAKFTRLDVAFDIYDKAMLDLEDIRDAINGGLCVSKWKKATTYDTRKLSDGTSIGGSDCGGFTFGSRSSQSYLRIYDKRQERLTKVGECERTYWVRIELEYKSKNAIAVSKLIVENASLDWFGANLRYYLDIKAPGQTDKNRSRWEAAGWWVTLTAAVKTRLPVVRKIVQDAIISAKRWIMHQVAPTLAFLLEIDGGDVQWIRDTMLNGKQKMSTKHKRVLANSTEGA